MTISCTEVPALTSHFNLISVNAIFFAKKLQVHVRLQCEPTFEVTFFSNKT